MTGHPTRRDWGSLGRKLVDVLCRCEATGDYQPYVDALDALREACGEEVRAVCGEAEELRAA